MNTEEFLKVKSDEYGFYTLIFLIVTSISCLLLNGWDRVIDPIMGKEMFRFRILMLLGFVIYLIPYKLKSNYKILNFASFLSIIYLLTIYVFIVSNLNKGLDHSIEGFVVAYLCLLAATMRASFKSIVIFNIVVLLYPAILDIFIFKNVIDYSLYFITMPIIMSSCIAVSYTIEISIYKKYLLTKKLKELSYIDTLTQCYNRLKFYDVISELNKNRKLNDKISIMIIDIDDFKRINDTFGHHIGDLVIKETVHNIKSSIRKEDILFRWGGEEFLALFLNTDIDECSYLSKRMVDKCYTSESLAGRVTISIGYGQFTDEDIDDFIEKIDKALYKAKSLGKNQAIKAI